MEAGLVSRITTELVLFLLTTMSEQQEEHDSLVHVKANDAFHKKKLQKEDESLELSYPLLAGEYVEYLGKACDAIISISNFRLMIRYADSFDNVPLQLIECVELRDMNFLHILCKDAQSVRCKFSTTDKCRTWAHRISKAIRAPAKLEDLFAFAFHAWCFDEGKSDLPTPGLKFFQQQKENRSQFILDAEAERMEFDLQNTWKICNMNRDFSLCSSYPKKHLIPACISNDQLKTVANFRSNKRFPSVVWRNKSNGAVIVRCSQPEVGWLGWRDTEDENMLLSILEACKADRGRRSRHMSMEDDGGGGTSMKENDIAAGDSSDSIDPGRESAGYSSDKKNMLLLDARSYAAAVANRAKGGGCECSEYYPCCEIQFMGLPNIHSVRKTFHSVRHMCSSSEHQPNWLSSLENTKWLHHLSLLLSSAMIIVNAIHKEQRPVVVHCSDGWDRTPQLTALSQLLLDPYYRTVQGFQVLVEREWLAFGHKFADRCGHAKQNDDANERCPVFLQWLDCVHQILKQFPTAFQFNETFLVKLVKHTFSCLFGTFLCNSSKEREQNDVKDRTCSVWSILEVESHKYRNYLYAPEVTNKVLFPACNIRNLHLWANVYMSDSVATSPDDITPTGPAPDVQMADASQLPRTKSCDDISKAVNEISEGKETSKEISNLHRTSSDPNLSDIRSELSIGVSPPRRGSDISPEALRKNINNLELQMMAETSIEEDAAKKDTESEPSVKQLSNTVITTNGFYKNDDEVDNSFDSTNHNGHVPNGIANGIATSMAGFDGSPKDCAKIPGKAFRTSLDAHLESSTETLTEEVVNNQVPEQNGLKNGHIDEISLGTNGLLKSKSSTISTSTTDISDSTIGLLDSIDKNRTIDYEREMYSKSEIFYKSYPPLSIKTSKSFYNGSNTSHARNLSGSSLLSSASEYSTPNASPRCELNGHGGSLDSHRSCVNGSTPSMLRIGRHLDEDGLTTVKDPYQNQMLAMERQHRRIIEEYETKLKQLKHLLISNRNFQFDRSFEPEFSSEEAHANTSRCDSIKSDVSWEEIDEKDGMPVLWVPDHAATECTGCQAKFQLWNRKHHCRYDKSYQYHED
ncbi:myotubularin-related protein 4-like isoform X2 [Anneissia japonica]|uniref:myotubularin-related protein 4-like isoform X2 n=1 Tax=Anneissia japonica TaxID=1529436 RepID=UPI0014258A2F|nr:myotubularin-related protein 4-like isoform X2 [Anneissia japonica]